MNVSLGKRWQEFVDHLIESGRYGSTLEVVSEGLRLVEEREAKLQALRETLDASNPEGRSHTDDEVAHSLSSAEASIAEKMNALRAALIEGEQSGPSAPFDFDTFIACQHRPSATR